jgi:N-acyl-D-aspartate/D-glutamate deacylase
MNRFGLLLLLVWLSGWAAASSDAPVYDLVLQGGRVIDPESGLDAVRNVGIEGSSIRAVSEGPLAGREVVDVTGLVVAPGFINLHSHAWTPLGQRFEVQDGVTTALELESGAYPASVYATYEPIAIADSARTNYGASVGHAWVRSAILEGEDSVSGFDELIAAALRGEDSIDMERPSFRQPLNAEQLQELRRRLDEGLREGGLGIGVLLDYMSEAVDEEELRIVFEVAAARQAPLFIHIRRGVAGDTSGLIEAIGLARATGAPLHICHLQANAMGNIAEFMRLIREAQKSGVKVSMESFPYNAGSTSISAAVFNRDWQAIFDISYEDVVWVETGERLTEESWERYRKESPAGAVIHHYNREEWTRQASEAPDVIVAADGVPIVTLDQKVAPFGIGTYARIYARYVREEGTLGLTDAVAKMTLLPARVLEEFSDTFSRKGRIRVDADADITVFDLDRIQDNATFSEPYQASTGIAHVIVGGEFALRDGELLEESFPGRRILR